MKKTNTEKLNVVIIFGGCSPEYGVSLSSASSVIRNLNREKYEPILIGITREGRWFHYAGPVERIESDTWKDDANCTPAALSPNRGEKRLLLLQESGISSMKVDIALPILHGRNGEDGTLQGLLELTGIPVAGCGTLASALCMDKDRAHKLVSCAGVRVPRALVLESPLSRQLVTPPDTSDRLSEIILTAKDFARETGYPIFVKPVKAGSSYGISRVTEQEQLAKAIELAFRYDSQVILEENIDGFEVGCAVLGTSELITGEIDEIELSGGFFDFTEKYTLKTSSIHVPARVSREKAAEIKTTAKLIYRALGCSGFARVDMFLTPNSEIVFNEVNTIPGFTEHSRYPGMMKAAGYNFTDVLDMILGQALS